MLGAQWAPAETFATVVDDSLRALHERLGRGERFLQLVFFCWQVVHHRRTEEERAMLKPVFERHVGKREVKAMARTGAEADRAEGAADALQELLLDMLKDRFRRIPGIPRAIRAIDDLQVLRTLARRAYVVESLAAFKEELDALRRRRAPSQARTRT